MKQLLLATVACVGMSSAAFAAEPVALTDVQLDKVTAGQGVATVLVLLILEQNSLNFLGNAVNPSGFATNLTLQLLTLPEVQQPRSQ